MLKIELPELCSAYASAKPASKYRGLADKPRAPSRHDSMQRELVETLRGFYADATVDFEVNVGGRWIDVLMLRDKRAYIFEIKTSHEAWNAGEIIRQLGLYAQRYEANKPILVLVHEGPLHPDEVWLFARKGIETMLSR